MDIRYSAALLLSIITTPALANNGTIPMAKTKATTLDNKNAHRVNYAEVKSQPVTLNEKESVTTTSEGDKFSLMKAQKSLDFTLAGLGAFGLAGTGPLAGFGATLYLSPARALRVGLQTSYTHSTLPANPGAGQSGTDGKQTHCELGLGGDYLMFMATSSTRVRPFIGAGGEITQTFDHRKNATINPTVSPEINGTNAGFKLAMRGIAGAEFLVTPEFGISGEYRLNVLSYDMPSDLVTKTGNVTVTNKQRSTLTLLGFGVAGVGVHIYF